MNEETAEPSRVILPTPEEYEEDERNRLGRANGNVYHRKAGVEGQHDGQIMIRLKKKRFIVVDYGITPDQAPEGSVCPEGAGTQICVQADCQKIGVPVLLFDSEPNEPASLYLRSGLCFVCQRTLNEKRRTQRKRKNEGDEKTKKRAKQGDKVLELGPDAIVINGPVEGTRPHSADYGIHEIALDLQATVQQASTDVDSLVSATEDVSVLYDKAMSSFKKGAYLLSQWKVCWDAAIAAAVAQESVQNVELADVVASAAAVAAASVIDGQSNTTTTNMIPLLLAANAKDGTKKDEKKEGDAHEEEEETEEAPAAAEDEEAAGGESVEIFTV